MSYDTETLEQALRDARDKLKQQNDLLEALTAGPNMYAHVVSVKGKKTVVAGSGGFSEVITPSRNAPGVGDPVVLSGKSGQILGLSDFQPTGDIRPIKKILENGLAEVVKENVEGIVFLGKFAKQAEIGDRVMVDPSGLVVTRNFGQPLDGFQASSIPNISWDDIGGLEDAKDQLREAIEYPHTKAELFKRYNKDPIAGVLLYGPPGCGKTMLVKAGANSLARIHGKQATLSGFIYIKGPEILNKWVGVSEEIVRSLFARARKHYDKHQYPATIFIDECDAVLRKRGSGRSSDVESTIVPAFLAEMDGFDQKCGVVVLATNRPDALDTGVVRDGRIDRKIEVPRPTASDALTIFKIHAKRVPLLDCTVNEAAKASIESLYSQKHVLYRVRRNDGESMNFTIGHLVNGAMIKGIVDRASSAAMLRDLKENTRKSGVRLADFNFAVTEAYRQSLSLNHQDELTEFVSPIKDQISGIDKLRQGEA